MVRSVSEMLAASSEQEIYKNFPPQEELHAIVADSATQVEIMFLKYYWILTYRKTTQQ